MLYYKFKYSHTGETLNLSKKTSKSVWKKNVLKYLRPLSFKKDFPKLD